MACSKVDFLHSGGMIHFWRVTEVCEWLKSIGLAEYREIFILFDIGGDRLLHLDKEQLKVFNSCSNPLTNESIYIVDNLRSN